MKWHKECVNGEQETSSNGNRDFPLCYKKDFKKRDKIFISGFLVLLVLSNEKQE